MSIAAFVVIADDRAERLRMVRDSVAAVVQPDGNLKRVRDLRFKVPGFDRATWQTMCDMGWPSLRLPEEQGGAGLGMAEFCALAEQLGAGLVPEPLVAAALSARLLAAAGDTEALPSLLSGERLILPAWQETAGAIECGARTTRCGGVLSGTKLFIPMAAAADAFLVVLPDAVALVESSAAGARLDRASTQDGGHYGTLTLNDVAAELLPVGPQTVAEALDEATMGVSATLLGVMSRAFAITLEYLRTRTQFGRPIGAFQALQHRAADLQLQVALTRASVGSAAATLDARSPASARQAAVSRAKIRASEAAMQVTREAIQMHGGIGYTDEADIGLFLRRAMVLANQHGAASTHRARFARLSAHGDEA